MARKNAMKIEAEARLEKISNYYGVKTGVPDRFKVRLQQLLEQSISDEDKYLALKRIYKSMELHALAEWANGRATGPLTPSNLEAKAKQAESLAKLLDKKGKPQAAAEQMKKAEALRAEASEIVAKRSQTER